MTLRIRYRLRLAAALGAAFLLGGCATAPAPEFPTEAAGPVYLPRELSRQPELIRLTRNDTPPHEPPASRKSVHASGLVEVDFIVGETGRVLAAQVTQTTLPQFAETVRLQFARLDFVPGEKDGRPVRVRLHRSIAIAASDGGAAVERMIRTQMRNSQSGVPTGFLP